MTEFILSAFADEIADDLQTQMDVLEQYGIRYIEMRGVNGKNVSDLTLDEAKAIKKQLDARGFKISALGSPIGKILITDDFAPHLQLFSHLLMIAKILETKYIRMFSFFIPAGEEPAKYRDEVMRRWRSFIEAAAGSGLILLHENEKEIYGDTPERCLDLLKTMNCDYLKAIFDPANFVQCNVETYPHAYELLKDEVIYMHVKDALATDHSVVPSGFGDGKVPEILTALDRRGYKGFLSIEPHLQQFHGFAKLERNAVSIGKESFNDGPGKFGVAYKALQKIITEIKG
ncbi:MAG TPA: sugar phosphate isomerase/epimerase family protein [Bacillota bacterium]|nr:sugar phosphate isomerase/epimerase family protein [Bacillota bacterium]